MPIPKHALLLILIAADLGALAYGILDAPDPPGDVIPVARGATAVAVMTDARARDGAPSDASHDGSFVVEIAADGRPGHGADLELGVRGAAALIDRVWLLDDRGLSRLRDAGGSERAEPGIEEFLDYPGVFRPDGAAGGRRRILAVGTDVAGVPSLLSFDGAAMVQAALPLPPGFTSLGGEQGPARAAIAAVGDDSFVVALRDAERAHVGSLRFDDAAHAAEAAWADPVELRRGREGDGGEPAGRPRLVSEADPRSFSLVQVMTASKPAGSGAARDAADELRVERFRVDGAVVSRVAGSSITVPDGQSFRGVLPAATTEDKTPALLLAGAHAARAVDLAGEDAGVPITLAAWNSRELRFERPMLAHLAMFMILALFARRRPVKEDRVVLYKPAPYVRRGFAFAIDFVIAAVASLLVYQLSAGEPEIAYGERYLSAFDTRPDPIAIVALIEWSFVLVVSGMLLVAIPEAVTGRSLGQRLCGLRVISLDGEPPSLGAVLTRAVLLPVEFTWFTGVFMFVTRRRQRLGDVLSGAVVVEDASMRVRLATPQDRQLFQA